MNKLILISIVVLIIINSFILYLFLDVTKFVCGYTGILDLATTHSCLNKNKQRMDYLFDSIKDGFLGTSQSAQNSSIAEQQNAYQKMMLDKLTPAQQKENDTQYQEMIANLKKQYEALNK